MNFWGCVCMCNLICTKDMVISCTDIDNIYRSLYSQLFECWFEQINRDNDELSVQVFRSQVVWQKMTRKEGNELKHEGEKKTYKNLWVYWQSPSDFEVHFEEDSSTMNIWNKTHTSCKSKNILLPWKYLK